MTLSPQLNLPGIHFPFRKTDIENLTSLHYLFATTEQESSNLAAYTILHPQGSAVTAKARLSSFLLHPKHAGVRCATQDS
eukprot:c30177_g1_i1 orf=46-285(+)